MKNILCETSIPLYHCLPLNTNTELVTSEQLRKLYTSGKVDSQDAWIVNLYIGQHVQRKVLCSASLPTTRLYVL